MRPRDVVITGVGLVSPLGKNAEETWRGVRSEHTGIRHVPRDDWPAFLQYIGQVHAYDLPQELPPKQLGQMKFLNRGSLLGFSATHEAISGHLDTIAAVTPGRRALYVASGDFTRVGFDFMYPALKDASDPHWQSTDSQKLNQAALNKVNPFFVLESLHNNLFSFLSAFVEFMGPNTSLASLSPCGGNALELAYRSIKQDKADIALAVGYGNWITEIPLYELEGLGMLSRGKSGIRSYRPFDRHRDGFIPGEGGAAILLESHETAKQHGSTIMATIRGIENRLEFSANHSFGVPDKVIKQNIISVLKDAECSMDDLAFVIPHGSGTRKGDRSELRSLHDLLVHTRQPPVCGLKPYTGHMGAASDLAEVILGMYAVQQHMVPATLNFTASETAFSNLLIANVPQTCDRDMFLSASYGLGGQSSSVVVQVCEQ